MYFAVVADVLYQFAVEAVAREYLGITYNDKFHLSPCDGDIHATEVTEEAYGAVIVVAHHAYHDNITFLTLESVDGIDCDTTTVSLEEIVHFKEPTYESRLRLIRGYDTKVGELIVNP